MIRTGGRRARSGAVAVAVVGALVLAGACSSDDGGGAAEGSSDGTTPVVAEPVGLDVLGPPDAEGPPQDGGNVVFGVEAEPDGLDPTRSAFDTSGHLMASAVFDPLVEIDDEGQAVPYLAESIEPDDDFTEWVITLRDGVTFHDGTALDADALALNLQFWQESFITAPSLAAVSGYEVTGPLEVTVTTSQPWVTFPYSLAGQTSYVAAPSFLENPLQDGPPMNPVGTGPCRLADRDAYVPGESFWVVRYDDYWQEGLPHLDGIRFDFTPDALERVSAIESGAADLIHGYNPVILDQARADAEAGDLKVVSNGTGEEDVIALNAERPPFDDPVARQALSHATDASAWRAEAESPADGQDHEVRSPWVEGQLGYTADDGYRAYAAEAAAQLADEYEATHGEPIRFELVSTTLVADQALSQILIDQWAEVGIEASIVTMPLSELVVTTVLGEFQAVNWRNFGAPDPDADYLWWHSSGIVPSPRISTNVARFADDEIDAALDAARAVEEPAERDAQYQAVARRLNEGAAYVWLGRPTWVVAAVPRVQGLAAAQTTMATLGPKTWLADLWVSG